MKVANAGKGAAVDAVAISGLTQSSRQLDPRAMTSRSSETPIPREQRSIEHFGERNVNGVVGSKVVAQFPNPRQ